MAGRSGKRMATATTDQSPHLVAASLAPEPPVSFTCRIAVPDLAAIAQCSRRELTRANYSIVSWPSPLPPVPRGAAMPTQPTGPKDSSLLVTVITPVIVVLVLLIGLVIGATRAPTRSPEVREVTRVVLVTETRPALATFTPAATSTSVATSVPEFVPLIPNGWRNEYLAKCSVAFSRPANWQITEESENLLRFDVEKGRPRSNGLSVGCLSIPPKLASEATARVFAQEMSDSEIHLALDEYAMLDAQHYPVAYAHFSPASEDSITVHVAAYEIALTRANYVSVGATGSPDLWPNWKNQLDILAGTIRLAPEGLTQQREPSSTVEPPIAMPNYRIVATEDVSFAGAVRLVFRVVVERGLTDEQLQRICEEIIEVQKKTRPHNAIQFFFYLPETDTRGRYTAGTGVWAPHGKWEDANSVRTGDYSQNILWVVSKSP